MQEMTSSQRTLSINLPEGWDVNAHTLWLNHQKQEAIQTLLDKINQSLAKDGRQPLILLKQFSYYLFLLQDYDAAIEVLQTITSLDSKDDESQLNLAVCLARADRYEPAVAIYQQLVKTTDDFKIWDGLANCQYRLGQFSESSQAGTRSLELKDASVGADIVPVAIANASAQVVAAHKKKIISFSLFGSNSRYTRGALHNILLVKQFYPDWICRFYIDEAVPQAFIELAIGMGCELKLNRSVSTLAEKLSWRFFVANDDDVGYFLIRDADSVFSQRESLAVNEWLASDRFFHVMRDWWTHTELILAGMWGGVSGVLPDMQAQLSQYQSQTRILETPNADQIFLREMIWPHVRQSVLIHDRCFRPRDSCLWPGLQPDGKMHVGQNEYAVREQAQMQFLKSKLGADPNLLALLD